jgi:diaminohydroxyphosphoribosylaminopyrimidine deaminase/5-amino-6-(5-phosphoribosylamino)uracil reductase
MHDKDYMKLALELARATDGQTSPNPSVGAVLVRNNQIVGIGTHLFAGQEHAEIYAIEMAKERAIGATLYVTLEPCVHYGKKTPPCAKAVIDAGIKSVYIATLDLNPEVSGKGVQALLDAGLYVEVGLLEDEAKQLNKKFFYYIQNKLPYLTLKAGLSLDSKLATYSGESQWITNSKSRADAHYYRHTHDAILVGIGTVLKDNPSLTTRIDGGGKNPIRIVLDTNLRTPLTAKVVTDGLSETWIICGNGVTSKRIDEFANYPQVKIIIMPTPQLDLNAILIKLAELRVASILVEGGNTIISSFLDAKLINQLVLYVSPILLGGESAPTFFAGSGFAKLTDGLKLEFGAIEHLDDNIKIIATRV